MFGWLWTTAIALWNLLEEWQQARGAATLGEYFGDWINLFLTLTYPDPNPNPKQARGAATLGEYFGDWINLFDQACVWTQVRAVRVSACGGSVHRWFSARTS